jgi:type IV pilus assembly protein PilX
MISPHNTQRGAALIVTLVMLLIMTLLGLSSMDATILGERLTGHQRNKQLSFDSAEMALREGEANAKSLGDTPDDSVGLYAQAISGDPMVWKDPDTNWADWAGDPIEHTVQNPVYVVELIGTAWRDAPCKKDYSDPDCFRPARRITAQGWGNNLNASSIVQSVFLFRND